MNNFIIGQVTPDMLTHLRYGTVRNIYPNTHPTKERKLTRAQQYIFFGLLTFGGAAFIYFFFPETKGLSLEEMDILFGSAGAAAADAERMREIAREVGLEDVIKGHSVSGAGANEPKVLDEKVGTQMKERDAESD
jgi:hypothetical protein